MDPTSPGLLGAVGEHTSRLLATAEGLDDVRADSLCEGWTRAHVLSHVARNADGLAALVRAAVDRSGETMYASPEQRDADIDAGADRPAAELVADVRSSADALAAQLPRLGPEHAGVRLERTPGVVMMTAEKIPFTRLRELVFHHVDLDAGFGFSDVEPELQRVLLEDEVRRLAACDPPVDVELRTTEGDAWTVGAGTASVSGSRGSLLGWLGRGLTEGVAGDALPPLPGGR
jgi:maleylpyruvate isomerase